jgi:ABC-type sugar transport system ATPase subunit
VDELVSMMVGHSVGEMFRREYQPQGMEALRVESLCSGKRLHDVSLTLRSGEIVGLAGLVGSGRTDLARAVFGVGKYDRGRIYLFGKEIRALGACCRRIVRDTA